MRRQNIGDNQPQHHRCRHERGGHRGGSQPRRRARRRHRRARPRRGARRGPAPDRGHHERGAARGRQPRAGKRQGKGVRPRREPRRRSVHDALVHGAAGHSDAAPDHPRRVRHRDAEVRLKKAAPDGGAAARRKRIKNGRHRVCTVCLPFVMQTQDKIKKCAVSSSPQPSKSGLQFSACSLREAVVE